METEYFPNQRRINPCPRAGLLQSRNVSILEYLAIKHTVIYYLGYSVCCSLNGEREESFDVACPKL